MKFLSQAAYAAFIILSTQSYAAENGINYDPAHSGAYLNAQKNNDVNGMNFVISKDLDQIKRMGFSIVKTFYSAFCTINGQNCIKIAELASARKMRILLGVYEFPDHPDWTPSQINAAVDSVFRFPGTVIAIAVGNEDMFDYRGSPIPVMQKRIVQDMTTIRNKISNPSVKVTTAQREPDWIRLVANDPYKVLANVEVIGANIYPFWGNSPEKINGKSVANNIQGTVNDLRAKTGKQVIVTEEGWPSCGSNPNTQDKTIEAEIDYFTTWSTRAHDFDSYYFAAYNNYSTNICPNDDANNHFGLCTADGKMKDPLLMKCD
jgi:exo-beta-1,3-glucanase (GH17 family)